MAIPSPTANPVPGIPVGVGDGNSRFSPDPLLVPDFYTPVMVSAGTGQVSLLSPNDLAGQSAYQRTEATATGTIGGTVASGHTLTLNFANGILKGSGGTRSVTYLTVGGETATTAALALASVVNADPVLKSFGIYATALGAVITFRHPGPFGQFTVVSFATTGAETCVFSPVGGGLTGGGGAAWPYNNFAYTYLGQTLWYRSRVPTLIPQPLLVAMARDGMPVA